MWSGGTLQSPFQHVPSKGQCNKTKPRLTQSSPTGVAEDTQTSRVQKTERIVFYGVGPCNFVGTAPKPAPRRAVSVLIKRVLTESSDPAAFFCVTQVNVASFVVLLALLKQQLPSRTFLALQDTTYCLRPTESRWTHRRRDCFAILFCNFSIAGQQLLEIDTWQI